MLTDQFEKFWNWILKELEKEGKDETKEWLEDKFYEYLAKEKPNGWERYYYEIQDRGYINDDVVKP